MRSTEKGREGGREGGVKVEAVEGEEHWHRRRSDWALTRGANSALLKSDVSVHAHRTRTVHHCVERNPTKGRQEPKQKSCALKFVTSCSISLLMIMTLLIRATGSRGEQHSELTRSRGGVPGFLPRLCDLRFVQTDEPAARRRT